MAKKRRTFAPEFREMILKRIVDEPITKVAREFKIFESVIHRWKNQAKKAPKKSRAEAILADVPRMPRQGEVVMATVAKRRGRPPKAQTLSSDFRLGLQYGQAVDAIESHIIDLKIRAAEDKLTAENVKQFLYKVDTALRPLR